MRTRHLVILAGVIAAGALLVAACGGGDSENGASTNGPTTSLDVGLDEFAVTPSISSVSAGAVTFNLRNDGATVHTFLVIRTDLAADALPVIEEDFIVDETELDVQAATEDIDAGETEEVTVDLEAGSYLLICNVPSHYESGMVAAFTVR